MGGSVIEWLPPGGLGAEHEREVLGLEDSGSMGVKVGTGMSSRFGGMLE